MAFAGVYGGGVGVCALLMFTIVALRGWAIWVSGRSSASERGVDSGRGAKYSCEGRLGNRWAGTIEGFVSGSL